VHATAELPLAPLLKGQGVQIHVETGSFADRLGLRHTDSASGVQIKAVQRGSAAEQAGLAAHDEWLGMDVGAKGQGGSWRIAKLAEVPELLGKERQLTALVSRDRQLLRLPLTVPQQSSVWRLEMTKDRTSPWPAA
jgi:predicted metalloprotease with PDZ domain